MLPPIPNWNELHPVIVHFPIGLLLITPVFIVLGAILRKQGRAFAISALILMVLGTLGAWVAVETGEAAAGPVDRSGEVGPALGHHARLAKMSLQVFGALTAVYAALTLNRRMLRKEPKYSVRLVIHGLFLLAYLGGCVLLANTGYAGGLLVHKYGVHSMMAILPTLFPRFLA